ncbi:MAG: aldo/keto reductase [Oscillospiraceae bacterium]|nr:aldo/keto reductase [Oscillospiraceae bacterium]
MGSTDLRVSAVGFGGLKLGEIPQDEANKLIERALEGGINYLDTARNYGGSDDAAGGCSRRANTVNNEQITNNSLEREKQSNRLTVICTL